MAYKKVGWKDYPSTDTPINATNLDHMDAGILENAQTIGDKTKISDIGDGTVAGAIAQNTQSLTNKLDASNVDPMFCESIPGRNQITNFLHVDLSNRNSYINKIH